MKGLLNRLGENQRGGKMAFKLENLARFNLTRDDLLKHEAIFRLAFMEAEVFVLLDELVTMWETQICTGSFLEPFCGLPYLTSQEQGVLLRGVIRGEYLLRDMTWKIVAMRRGEEALCGTWTRSAHVPILCRSSS